MQTAKASRHLTRVVLVVVDHNQHRRHHLRQLQHQLAVIFLVGQTQKAAHVALIRSADIARLRVVREQGGITVLGVPSLITKMRKASRDTKPVVLAAVAMTSLTLSRCKVTSDVAEALADCFFALLYDAH